MPRVEKEKNQKKPSHLKDALKALIVLVMVATIAGLILGVVNIFTQIDENAVFNKKVLLINKMVYPDETTVQTEKLKNYNGDLFSKEVNSGIIVTAAKIKAKTDRYVFVARGAGAYAGSLDLYVLVDDGMIKKITVAKSGETPGLGSKALDQSYLLRYEGLNIEKSGHLNLVKKKSSDNEIEIMTGVSKTSNGIINAINAVIREYKDKVKK